MFFIRGSELKLELIWINSFLWEATFVQCYTVTQHPRLHWQSKGSVKNSIEKKRDPHNPFFFIHSFSSPKKFNFKLNSSAFVNVPMKKKKKVEKKLSAFIISFTHMESKNANAKYQKGKVMNCTLPPPIHRFECMIQISQWIEALFLAQINLEFRTIVCRPLTRENEMKLKVYNSYNNDDKKWNKIKTYALLVAKKKIKKYLVLDVHFVASSQL